MELPKKKLDNTRHGSANDQYENFGRDYAVCGVHSDSMSAYDSGE
jgi:hypothetical protein